MAGPLVEKAAVSAAFGHCHGGAGAPLVGPIPGDLLMVIIGHVVGFAGGLGGSPTTPAPSRTVRWPPTRTPGGEESFGA
jgi:hypothetical protein